MRYSPKTIEAKWQKKWQASRLYEPDLKHAKKPFYNLMMFPYPSAEGLHVGNMYAFVGSDIYGRFKRQQGYQVFEPIGLDGFGIHSENYALKVGAHPMAQAEISEARFYKQLQMIGNGFAWNEHLETYDPEYYRWTQWIFIQMFKKGLAYRKKAAVNWCPSCLTVLADEQVIQGECERCGSRVVKKDLEQWFFKITDYAPRLLENLARIDWSENVKIAQEHWLGKSEGAEVEFPVAVPPGGQSDTRIKVFTTRADTIFGATYVMLAPEHPYVSLLTTKDRKQAVESYLAEASRRSEAERTDPKKIKTGVFTGSFAVNPANGEKIPIWVGDYVLGNVGTGAIMAVPAHDERDFEFAKKFNLPIREVVSDNGELHGVLRSAYTAEGKLVNSDWADGLRSQDARRSVAESLGARFKTQYRLRDWLISRQRYWGPPIPMIQCDHCRRTGRGARKDMPGWYPVAEKDLPVKLPFVKNFRPTGRNESPLASVESFFRVRCPGCRRDARRETDVSDTFLDSAWYYYRYISVADKKRIWDSAVMKKWLPVDMYIGGAEHSVLHLLYTRFLTMVLHDWKLVPFSEPFKKFRTHGLLIKDGTKMSKSKGNVVNPDEYIKQYGADAIRMYLMFLGPFMQGGDFRDDGIQGITRFLNRVWDFTEAWKKRKKPVMKTADRELLGTLHRAIAKITGDIEELRYNTAISALMVLMRGLEDKPDAVGKDAEETLLKLLAPFAPHMSEELWNVLGNKGSIHTALWPRTDKKYLQEETFLLVVQVNGKTRATLLAAIDSAEEHARSLALADERVKKYVIGVPRRVVFVKNKLINFVV